LIVDETTFDYFQSPSFVTDVPVVGSEIQPGHPVVTIHADADDQQVLKEVAAERTRELREQLASQR